MSEQSNAAAERSAHVTRNGPDKADTISPVVETAPGIYRLRVLVEAEARAARQAAAARRAGFLAGLDKAAVLAEQWGEPELRDEILALSVSQAGGCP